ncbi:MAG: pyridoxal-dependent decarboxylase [Dermatophilaceae bacterium]
MAADEEGRIGVEALRAALAQVKGPVIVCAQAGNIHSGSFDAFGEIAAATHAAGGWLHIDGAFGLWAAASPQLAHLVPGLADADSWATDAHKTLNTPYDTGVAVVRDAAALTRAFGHHAAYLLEAATPDPHEMVPEMSRRARGVPVWAALSSLGRDGVAALVDGMVTSARRLAEGLAQLPGVEVLHDVVYTQVSVAAESDERTSEVLRRVLAEGVIHPSGSRWQDRTVIRFSVSNHATDAAAVDATVEAMLGRWADTTGRAAGPRVVRRRPRGLPPGRPRHGPPLFCMTVAPLDVSSVLRVHARCNRGRVETGAKRAWRHTSAWCGRTRS